MRQYGETLWTFETARFRVEFRVTPCDYEPDFDNADEIKDDIAAGRLEWFNACVDVVLKDTGAVLGRDTLGGCCYKTFEEFYTAHRTDPYESRNTLAAKDAGVVYCHYFPEMVSIACQMVRKYGNLHLRDEK